MQLERSECKYLLTEQQAARALRHFSPHLERDRYAARTGGRYPICSLYLDSADLALHRETCEGQRRRFKLRIRSYSDDPSQPAHLEIKRREGSVIHKQRVAVPRARVRAELTGVAGEPSFPEFTDRLQTLAGRPTVLVRYEREAYVGAFGRNTRVTFDRRLMAALATGHEVRHGGGGWRAVETRRVVLELKFTGLCPAWMARGIQQLELRRQSFSKNCNSVLATRLDEMGALR